MSIHFKAVAKNIPTTTTFAGYYPTVVSKGYYDLDDIADRIAANCMVTVHDVKGILSALQQHIGTRLQTNQSVQLGDLGSFRPVVNCTAVTTYADLSTGLIKRIRAEFRASAGMDEAINLQTCSFAKISESEEEEESETEETVQ